MTSRGLRLPVLLLALGASGCGHPIDGGTWRLDQDRQAGTTLDTCSLLASDGTLGEGRMTVTGEELRWTVPAPGLTATQLMIGRFKNPVSGKPDEFSLDGSVSGAKVAVSGASCQVQFGQTQLDATVLDATSFSGSLTVHYELGPSAERCPATCDVQVGVRGAFVSK